MSSFLSITFLVHEQFNNSILNAKKKSNFVELSRPFLADMHAHDLNSKHESVFFSFYLYKEKIKRVSLLSSTKMP